MQTDFDIKILRQHWITNDGTYDPADPCSHGEVFVRIGDEVLSDTGDSWTLSAFALYLLRSLDATYKHDKTVNSILPCCGHTFYPDDEDECYVTIDGCPNGIHWTISHEDDRIVFESEKGSKGILPKDKYKDLVRNLVSEIETFFGNPTDKTLSGDDYDQRGFEQFWKEWRSLKQKWL